MRVVVYSRVSTIDQNIEIQTDELKAYCKARSWEVVEEVSDFGFSGGTDKRPGLNRVLELAKRRMVDAVVVTKLDRVFRSLKHLVCLLNEFNELRISFVSLRDQIDLSTAAGQLMTHILGAFAEFERQLIRERTIAGLIHAKSKGKTLGRPKTRDDGAIRTLRARGFSYTQIQKELNCSRGSIYRSLLPVSKSYSNSLFKQPKKSGS